MFGKTFEQCNREIFHYRRVGTGKKIECRWTTSIIKGAVKFWEELLALEYENKSFIRANRVHINSRNRFQSAMLTEHCCLEYYFLIPFFIVIEINVYVVTFVVPLRIKNPQPIKIINTYSFSIDCIVRSSTISRVL